MSTATALADSPPLYGRGLVSPVAALTADVPPIADNPLGQPGGQSNGDGNPGDGWQLWLVGGVAMVGLSILIAGLVAGLLYRRRRAR